MSKPKLATALKSQWAPCGLALKGHRSNCASCRSIAAIRQYIGERPPALKLKTDLAPSLLTVDEQTRSTAQKIFKTQERLRLKAGPHIEGTEQQLLRSILDHLALRFRGRLIAWRNSSGAAKLADGRFLRFGCVGSADILGCLQGGRLVALEVKTSRGVVSKEQTQWLASMRAQGALAVVVRSVDAACAVIDVALKEREAT